MPWVVRVRSRFSDTCSRSVVVKEHGEGDTVRTPKVIKRGWRI